MERDDRRSAKITALAESFFEAVLNGDRATIERIYHQDFEFWHNGHFPQDKQAAVYVTSSLSTWLPGMRYTEVKRQVTQNGFVQQCVVTGKDVNGDAFSTAICMVLAVRDGQIARIDEYFDSSTAPALPEQTPEASD